MGEGLRGGIFMTSNRFSNANNPYLPKYDPSILFDAPLCTLRSQPLPTDEFVRLTSQEMSTLDVEGVLEDSEKEEKESYCQEFSKDLNLGSAPVPTLVHNLEDKIKYIVHYQNLKQYLALATVLTKINRVPVFQQSSCLKSYIAFNTEKGKHTANDFEKRLFNLINNFLIDKTMGNLSKRVNVKVVKNYLKLTNLTASPSFDSFRIYFKDLAALNMKKTKLYLNRPIYVGFAIFYLSKVFMYQIYYDCMKRTLGPTEKLYFLPTPIVFATT